MRFRFTIPFAFLLAVSAVPMVARAQFQPVAREELAMTTDSKAPGAAAVYLYREETEDDPHAFRTIYARIKVLTDAGKNAAVVQVSFPKTFVYNAVGNNSSYLASGDATSFSLPAIERNGEDQPWDTDSYQGKVEIGAIEGRVTHADGTVVPLTGKASQLLKVTKGPRATRCAMTAISRLPTGNCKRNTSSTRSILSFGPPGSFFPRM
jgi:hypothetical protein